MLYIITKPFDLLNGAYNSTQISSDAAANLIREADSANKLTSLVHFASTAHAVRSLASVDIKLVDRAELPQIIDGDELLHIRLKKETPKGQKVGIIDLEFWHIEYRMRNYETSRDFSQWPMVVDD